MGKGKFSSVHFDRESKKFAGLDALLLNQLKDAHPRVDVDTEIKKMCIWLNTEKGSQRLGNLSFISNWLSNAKQSPLPQAEQEPDEELQPYLNAYDREKIWKGREHILAMNQKKDKKP